MKADDDDLPLGVPVVKRSTIAPRKIDRSGVDPDAGRHPEDEIGLPKQVPTRMHEPTAKELAALQLNEEIEAKRLYHEAVKARLSRFAGWGRSYDRILFWTALFAGAILALFVLSQTLQILSTVSLQPFPIRAAAYAGLLVIFGILCFFAVRLAVMLIRIKLNRQVSVAQLAELSRRAELRDLVERDKARAKKTLENYLRSFPLEKTTNVQLERDELDSLRESRDYLLDSDRFSDYDQWIKEFQVRFQTTLQCAADRIVKRWMNLVALKTALSSSPLIDTIVVLNCSYAMIGELCQLYNVRMARTGLLRLLAFSFANSFMAGQLEEHADELIENAADSISGIAQKLGVSFHEALGSVPVVGDGLKMAGKIVADAAVNAFLLRRLGRSTIKLLSPIAC